MRRLRVRGIDIMEMKQISETTLKITISMDDLEERGMELKDFLIPQEKTEEFFYSVMDELELPDNFKDSGMLSFRVTPRKDRLDVFVTKSDLNKELNLEDLSELGDMSTMTPEDFFKTIEETMKSKGDTKAHEELEQLEESLNAMIENSDEGSNENVTPSEIEEAPLDYIHYVFHFETLEQAIIFSRVIDFPVEASELYKESGTYHMTVLLDIKDKPQNYTNLMYARMLEHAGVGTKTRPYLQEHGIQLLNENAVSFLKKLELV